MRKIIVLLVLVALVALTVGVGFALTSQTFPQSPQITPCPTLPC